MKLLITLLLALLVAVTPTLADNAAAQAVSGVAEIVLTSPLRTSTAATEKLTSWVVRPYS